MTPPTARELEVLNLMADGKCNKEMADVLGISVKTVEKHRQALFKKLGPTTAAGMCVQAVRSGLIR